MKTYDLIANNDLRAYKTLKMCPNCKLCMALNEMV